jgi:hypothetical protein
MVRGLKTFFLCKFFNRRMTSDNQARHEPPAFWRQSQMAGKRAQSACQAWHEAQNVDRN